MSKRVDALTHAELCALVCALRNRLLELEGKVYRLERKVSPRPWPTAEPRSQPQLAME